MSWVYPYLNKPCVCVCVCVLYIYLEKEMATHSSTLAWKISWMEEPRRLQSLGLQRVGHDWVTSLLYMYTHTHTHTSSSFSQSHVRLFVTPWTAAHQVPLSSIISKSWLNFMSIESVININIHAYICVCVCVCIQTYIHIYFIKSYRNIDYICMVYILKSITVLYVVSTMYW